MKSTLFRRSAAVLMTVALSLSLLPAPVSALSPADLINQSVELARSSFKTMMDNIVADWNKTSFSEKSGSTMVYVWDGATGAQGCAAFSRYAFYKLYGHGDNLKNSHNTVSRYIVYNPGDALNALTMNAAPGDAVRISRMENGAESEKKTHIFNLFDIDSSGKIYIYESNYTTPNKARAHTYDDTAVMATKSGPKLTVSGGTFDYPLLIKIIHSDKNPLTSAALSCHGSSGPVSVPNTGSTSGGTKYGKIHDTDGNLAINSKPASGNMIGKIPEGGICTVYPDKASGNWYWVEYNGVSGYSYGKYITLSDTRPASSLPSTVSSGAVHGTIHDTDGNLAINQQPKSTANGAVMLGKIPEGQTCIVYPDKASGNWYWVEYNGVSGYAYGKYITLGSAHAVDRKVDAVLSTCTDSGRSAYYSCSQCGQCYRDAAGTLSVLPSALTTPPAGHTFEHFNARTPSCTEEGNIEYWLCTECGRMYDNAEGSGGSLSQSAVVLDPLDHSYRDGVCVRCGETDPEAPAVIGTVDPVTDPVSPDAGDGVHFPRHNTYRQGQFIDVPAGQWFTANVADAYSFGLMKGTGSDTFSPYGDVTLAEAVTMAARIHSVCTTGSEHFVQSGVWYQCYVDYALDNGIIGTSILSGDITRKATRLQFASIFAGALPEEALPAINTIPDNSIPDVGIRSGNAASVYLLYRAGILTGSDALGTFFPGSFITRAESAAIVSRMAESDNRVPFSLD